MSLCSARSGRTSVRVRIRESVPGARHCQQQPPATGIHALTPSRRARAHTSRDSHIHAFTPGAGPRQQGFTRSRPHTAQEPPATGIHALTPSQRPKRDSHTQALTPGASPRRAWRDSRTHAFTLGTAPRQQGFTHSHLHTGCGPRAARIHALTRSRRAGGATQQQRFTHSRFHTGLLPPAKRIHAFTPSHWARAPGSKDSRTHALTPRGRSTQQQGFTHSRLHTACSKKDSRIHALTLGTGPRAARIHALTPSRRAGDRRSNRDSRTHAFTRPVAASKKDSRSHAFTLGTGPGQQGFTHSRPHAARETDAATGIHALTPSHGLLPPAKRIHAFTRSHWARAPGQQGFTHSRPHAAQGDRRSNRDSRTHAFTRPVAASKKDSRIHALTLGTGPRAARIHALTPSRRAGGPTQQQGFTHSRLHTACCRQQKGFTQSRAHTGHGPPGSKDSRTHALTPRGGTDAATGIHALTPSHGLLPPVTRPRHASRDSRTHAFTLCAETLQSEPRCLRAPTRLQPQRQPGNLCSPRRLSQRKMAKRT